MRKPLNWVARPEGLEPPTYRFEVRSNTESHGIAGKKGSVFLLWAVSLPCPTLSLWLILVARW